MQIKLDLNKFNAENVTIGSCQENDIYHCEFNKSGGHLLYNVENVFEAIELKSNLSLTLFITNKEKHLQNIGLEFYDRDNHSDIPDLMIEMGLIPDIRTTLSIPFKLLDSQQLFPKRTPGKLKTVVRGNKVEVQRIGKIGVASGKSFEHQHYIISNILITDETPQFMLPDIKLVDKLGQIIDRHWAGKTKNEMELKAVLNEEFHKPMNLLSRPDINIFGGWEQKKFSSTGFFRTHRDAERWWLIDPQGCSFVSMGVDCICPGETGRIQDIEKFYTWIPEKNGVFQDAHLVGERFDEGNYYNFGVSNLIRVFGDKWENAWTRITKNRLIEWGFNTVGNWSSIAFAQKSQMPYVLPLEGFPDTKNKIFRDFPDVFSKEYETNAQIYAHQLKTYKYDPYLIGYFMRNEPNWAFVEYLNIAEELLSKEEEFESKNALIDFLRIRYKGDIQQLNTAWNTQFIEYNDLNSSIKKATKLSSAANIDLYDFSCEMIRKYVEVPARALRKVDVNHLNLGMRYAWIWDKMLYSGCENFDVFSFNCYKLSPIDEIRKIGKDTGLPVIIGEFHFGALDRGLFSNGLRSVLNQEERGKAYRYYIENAIQSEYFVGAHYFILNDQHVLGRFDGENAQVGCVDVCHRPYKEFVEGVKKTNEEIYQLVSGIKTIENIKPIEVQSTAI